MAKTRGQSPITYILVLMSEDGQVCVCVPTIQDLEGARKVAKSCLALDEDAQSVRIHSFEGQQMAAEPVEIVPRESASPLSRTQEVAQGQSDAPMQSAEVVASPPAAQENPRRNYILKYKVQGGRMQRVPLDGLTEDQALQHFEGKRAELLLIGEGAAVYVRLFTQGEPVPHRETLFRKSDYAKE